MIAHLRGTVHRLSPGAITMDVGGVGYAVSVPLDAWDSLEEGSIRMLWIVSYIREDRFDLFGFPDITGKKLFESLIDISGIGPRLALELCAVPRTLLLQAIRDRDPALLTGIKGIGKKSAEKLLLELRSMQEKQPDIFGSDSSPTHRTHDADALAALTALGYDTPTALGVLQALPENLSSTEQRVEAALRAL